MIITVANQKGGVGKTTTALALAGALQLKGYKVLLVDADQQTNATDTYRAQIDDTWTLYDIMNGDIDDISNAIQETDKGFIIAGDPGIKDIDVMLGSNPSGYMILKKALEKVRGFDYIVIDTAPAIGKMLYNCLVASDKLIIPITADRYSMQGLSNLNEAITSVKEYFNHGLDIAGILLCQYNQRTNLSKDARNVLEGIAKQLDTKVFDTSIRKSTKTQEAQAMRVSLFDYAPNSTTAQDYISFTEELLKEI